MDDAHGFLQTLAVVLCVAAVTTVLFQRLKQPVVLGYLLAGMVVGPYIPIPLHAESHTVDALAELGVILLMFSLGIEFSLTKLLRVGTTAGFVAIVQCSLMLWLGYVIGQAFGWSHVESIFAGAVIAISSTTIIVKAFEEQGIKDAFTQVVFGILIVEDLIAILLLTILTTISSGEELSAVEFGRAVGHLAAFLAIVMVVGLFIVPRLDAGRRSLEPRRDDGRCERGNRVRLRHAGCDVWLLGRARRVSRRSTCCRVRGRKDRRAPGATGPRYIRGHLFRLGRNADRSVQIAVALARHARVSRGRDRWKNPLRHGRRIPHRAGRSKLGEDRHEPRADWRILVHHCRRRSGNRCYGPTPLFDGGRGFGDHDAADALVDSHLSRHGRLDRSQAASIAANLWGTLRLVARETWHRPRRRTAIANSKCDPLADCRCRRRGGDRDRGVGRNGATSRSM